MRGSEKFHAEQKEEDEDDQMRAVSDITKVATIHVRDTVVL